MFKCKYNEDCSRYPACGHTCGKPLEELLWHKCQVIRDLEHEMKCAKTILNCVIGDAHKIENILWKEPYRPTCPYGYTDCISDPAYIRWNHPEWWEELGMPTECECADEYEEGCSCRYYDDEDK